MSSSSNTIHTYTPTSVTPSRDKIIAELVVACGALTPAVFIGPGVSLRAGARNPVNVLDIFNSSSENFNNFELDEFGLPHSRCGFGLTRQLCNGSYLRPLEAAVGPFHHTCRYPYPLYVNRVGLPTVPRARYGVRWLLGSPEPVNSTRHAVP